MHPSPSQPAAAPITHYENFPVASWLCPPTLRAPIAAIYHFARTADDIADEGDTNAAQRVQDLTEFRRDLSATVQAPQGFHSARWPAVFGPLGASLQSHQLPTQLLHDLLDAFVQDVEKTDQAAGYASHAELLDYCRRSANPVGRLLLHLYGVHDPLALQRSDAICTALQLINFWQDISVDIPRGRYYLPLDAMRQHGVVWDDLLHLRTTPNAIDLIAACAHQARATMLSGTALVHQVPGRAGWELRLVVQGGLRILDKIEGIGFATLTLRPTLRWWDFPVMVWRALWM